MRIVAGKHKGRTLSAPAGREVRPTGDRVRESLFNLLAHGDYGGDGGSVIEGASVLDAFAGSGALGLEAMSRGASECTFMEIAAPALSCLKENRAALGEGDGVRILKCDATRPPPALAPADLVFLDPPYKKGLLSPAVAALRDQGWIGEDTLGCAELGAGDELDLGPQVTILQDRRYGRTRIVLFRLGG